VRGRNPVHTSKKKQDSKESPPAGWFPLPPKLESPDASGLSCTIDARRISYDIDLK
jgi:hypothetical protein